MIWLYHLRRDSLGEFAGFRIDLTMRPFGRVSSHTASPAIDRTTSGASCAVNGASGGASSESYSRPKSNIVGCCRPCVASHALAGTLSNRILDPAGTRCRCPACRAAPSSDFAALPSIAPAIS